MNHRGHQFVIVKLFILTSTCPHVVQHISSPKWCRALVGELYLFISYALHCLITFRNL
nr:MAG TPA_asm: hypothetical protein [Caudoviricetes sp.]